MSAASLPTARKRLVLKTGDSDDIDVLTDTESDAESEDEPEPVARWDPAEDELAYRPKHGYGQRPCAMPNRAHFQKPLRNITIAFARDMQKHGDIAALPSNPRRVLQELLEADQKLKETAGHNVARLNTPIIRRTAEEVFPGEISSKKEVPHFGSRKNANSANNAFSKLQLQRALYEDGNDDVDGLQAMDKPALLSMWMQRRHELRSAQEADQREDKKTCDGAVVLVGGAENVPAVPGNVHISAPTVQVHDDEPISLANMYSPQEPPVSNISVDAEILAETSAQSPTNPIGNVTEAPTAYDAALAHTTPPGTGRGRKKNGENDVEVARRIALAARVGRFPLSLPGNNYDAPLSMQLNLSASTIKSKYNVNMTTQLLKDYGILPTDPSFLKPHINLTEHLVKEREKLIESRAKLQEPWSIQRLEAYVAAQEAKGAIPPASDVHGAGPANAQGSQLPSLTQGSAGPTPTHGPSMAPKKRGRVEEDLQEDESLSQMQPQNMARIKKAARTMKFTKIEKTTTSLSATPGTHTTTKKRSQKEKNPRNGKVGTWYKIHTRKAEESEQNVQATSPKSGMPSAYVMTDYVSSVQSLPVANRIQCSTPPISSAYTLPFHCDHEQHLIQDGMDQASWGRHLHELHFGTVTQSPPQQQSEYQGYSTFVNTNAYQQDSWQPSQALASAYTMPPTTSQTNDTTQSSAPDIPIDPALFNL